MILVLAGTTEGRQVATGLCQQGFKVLVSTATAYGGSLYQKGLGNIEVISGELGQRELETLIGSPAIEAVVDTTHPFAEQISKCAGKIAKCCGKPYFRWSRNSSILPWENKLLQATADWSQAAEVAADLANTILLTTGSRWLSGFSSHPSLRGKRLLARVLPLPGSVQICLDCGILPQDIIALQGPCSKELNIAIYKQYGVEAIITKESGPVGGTEEKVSAAIELGLPIIIIERPEEDPEHTVSGIEELSRFLRGEDNVGRNFNSRTW